MINGRTQDHICDDWELRKPNTVNMLRVNAGNAVIDVAGFQLSGTPRLHMIPDFEINPFPGTKLGLPPRAGTDTRD